MAVPELNEDILAVICACLTDVSDVLAISLTCSSVRRLAIKQLLSLRPIHLSAGDLSIQRFHYFLFADAPARLPLIRALDIETRLVRNRSLSPQRGDASLLMDILTSCKLLERISFGRITFPLPRLTKDPSVIDAIASVQSLRSLVIQNPIRSCPLPHLQAQSPFRQICPLMLLRRWCRVQLVPSLAPGVSLSPRADPRGAQFPRVDVDPQRIQGLQNLQGPAQSFAGWNQYPAVHSLSVHFSVGRLLFEPLQHLFPAIDGTFSVGCIDYDYPADTFSDIRAANQRAQDRIKNGDRARRHGWTKLRHLACPVEAFYILGLCCPIDFAMIDGMDWTFTPQHNWRCLTVSLRENPVPRLTLCLALDDKLEVFGGVFGSALGTVLTHLTLVLDTVSNWTSPPLPGRFGWDELLVCALLSTPSQPISPTTDVHCAVFYAGQSAISVSSFTPRAKWTQPPTCPCPLRPRGDSPARSTRPDSTLKAPQQRSPGPSHHCGSFPSPHVAAL